jgi:hypothetical protein
MKLHLYKYLYKYYFMPDYLINNLITYYSISFALVLKAVELKLVPFQTLIQSMKA